MSLLFYQGTSLAPWPVVKIYRKTNNGSDIDQTFLPALIFSGYILMYKFLSGRACSCQRPRA